MYFCRLVPSTKKKQNTRIFLLAFGLLQKIISVAKKRFMTLTCFVHDNFDDKCNFFKSWSLNPIIRCKKINIGHMALQCDHFSRIYQKHCFWDVRTGKKILICVWVLAYKECISDNLFVLFVVFYRRFLYMKLNKNVIYLYITIKKHSIGFLSLCGSNITKLISN